MRGENKLEEAIKDAARKAGRKDLGFQCVTGLGTWEHKG